MKLRDIYHKNLSFFKKILKAFKNNKSHYLNKLIIQLNKMKKTKLFQMKENIIKLKKIIKDINNY